MRLIIVLLLLIIGCAEKPCKKKLNLVFDGNSLTYGAGSSDRLRLSYPAQIFTKFNATPQNKSGEEIYFKNDDCSVVGWNLGVNGQQTSQMIKDATQQIDCKIDSKATNILFAWEGTNDLYYNKNPSDAIDNLVEYCKSRRASGWKVIIIDIIDREQSDWVNGNTASLHEEQRKKVNDYLSDHWHEFSDGLIQLSNVEGIGIDGSALKTMYFNPDKVHLNDSGYELVAGIASDLISTKYL